MLSNYFACAQVADQTGRTYSGRSNLPRISDKIKNIGARMMDNHTQLKEDDINLFMSHAYPEQQDCYTLSPHSFHPIPSTVIDSLREEAKDAVAHKAKRTLIYNYNFQGSWISLQLGFSAEVQDEDKNNTSVRVTAVKVADSKPNPVSNNARFYSDINLALDYEQKIKAIVLTRLTELNIEGSEKGDINYTYTGKQASSDNTNCGIFSIEESLPALRQIAHQAQAHSQDVLTLSIDGNDSEDDESQDNSPDSENPVMKEFQKTENTNEKRALLIKIASSKLNDANSRMDLVNKKIESHSFPLKK